MLEIGWFLVVDKNGEPTEALRYAARMKPATELKVHIVCVYVVVWQNRSAFLNTKVFRLYIVLI